MEISAESLLESIRALIEEIDRKLEALPLHPMNNSTGEFAAGHLHTFL